MPGRRGRGVLELQVPCSLEWQVLFTLIVALITFGVADRLPSASPRSVGMSAERLRAIDKVVERGLKAGGYPGAVVIVGRKGAAVWEKGYGYLGWSPASGAVDPAISVYDLASLTKVVGVSTALMMLYDEGRLHPDDYAAQHLPGFGGGDKDSITIRDLLTHYSGLPAGRDLWRVTRQPQEARQMVIQSALACKPRRCFIYSDIGADILGFIVEEVSGQSLDVFLAERLFEPLGMQNTFFRPADSFRSRIAPTEVAPPRGYPIRGEVHDENAYVLGGVAGHAGIFSTATDLSLFAQMMLNRGELNGVRIVSDSAVDLFTRRTVGSRALGWDTGNGSGGAGDYFGSDAYGHTGYTGTSLWIDPKREMFVILLTNRVHAARAPRPGKIIADVRNDLADAAALAVVEAPLGPLEMPVSWRTDREEGWKPPARRPNTRRSPARARTTSTTRRSS